MFRDAPSGQIRRGLQTSTSAAISCGIGRIAELLGDIGDAGRKVPPGVKKGNLCIPSGDRWAGRR
jgi:hypothetical protein